MNTIQLETHDLYLRHVDKRGRERVECHRVWDAVKFLDRADKDARREGGSVAVISEQAYRQSKWRKK